MVRKALMAVAFAAAFGVASAQEYPVKPVRFLLGGGPDAALRMITERLSAAWGQPMLVENKPAVSGTLMSKEVASSPPDGYTLMFCSSGQFTVEPFFKVSYDMARDFAGITQVTTMPFVLSVNPKVPAANVNDLIAMAKAKPGSLNYPSSGDGSPPHVVMEMFNIESGVKIVHVPYKTVQQATADLLGNHVQVMMIVATALSPLLQNNSVRPLAVSSTRRSPFLPDVPTLQEATGLPIPGADAWNGFCAPAGTPAPVINKLYREIVAIIRTPEITKRLGALTNEVVGSSPEEFSAFMRAERAKWFKYAKILNVVPQ